MIRPQWLECVPPPLSRDSNQSPPCDSAKWEFHNKTRETFRLNWECWFESRMLRDRRTCRRPRICGLFLRGLPLKTE
jgi:hypothetical protein